MAALGALSSVVSLWSIATSCALIQFIGPTGDASSGHTAIASGIVALAMAPVGVGLPYWVNCRRAYRSRPDMR